MKSGIPVRIIPHLTKPIRPLKDLRALAELIKTIQQESPDLIHAHTSKAGILARVAARLTGKRVVFTAHTWSFAEGIPRSQRLLAIPLERLAGALGGTIIAVSQANKEVAMRRSIASADSIVRIWNGVPDVVHEVARLGQSSNVGHGRPVRTPKGPPAADRRSSGIRGNWRLLLIGDGRLRPKVEEAIAKAGLRDQIE